MKEFKRIYKLQNMGGSYYVVLPKVLVKAGMLKFGVFMEVLKVDDEVIILRLRVADVKHREHDKSNKKSGENTQKSRTASGVC